MNKHFNLHNNMEYNICNVVQKVDNQFNKYLLN